MSCRPGPNKTGGAIPSETRAPVGRTSHAAAAAAPVAVRLFPLSRPIALSSSHLKQYNYLRARVRRLYGTPSAVSPGPDEVSYTRRVYLSSRSARWFFAHVKRPKNGARFYVLLVVGRQTEIIRRNLRVTIQHNDTEKKEPIIMLPRRVLRHVYYPGISSRYQTVFGPKCEFHRKSVYFFVRQMHKC